MNDWISFVARTSMLGTSAGPTGAGGGATQSPVAGIFPIALMFAFLAFMLLTMRGQKKREKRERAELFAKLAKNDRVLTVGGVIGTVVSVKENEVLLKVDESTNTKMTFLKSSVQRIITEDKDLAAAK